MSVLSKLRYPLYQLYETRLKRELRGKKRPKHIAVMADGNRRWARESGFKDISHGHRVCLLYTSDAADEVRRV